jgi:transcriptional regulator with XRE-family HTH domain
MDNNAADIDFRTWLKLELERHDLSQSELARMSGVPQPTIQRIISGETGDPRGSTITKLREILRDQLPPIAVSENRRARLKEWFSDKTLPKKEKSYLSQLIGGKASFGEKAARRLENTYGMPDGHLDAPFRGGLALSMHDTMKRLYQAADEIRGLRGQSEVSGQLNASSQVLNNWESRGMSKGGMLTAQEKIGCSAVWLATGKGEMRLDGAAPSPLPNSHAELLEAWTYLLPAEREAIMAQIRPMADHNKAVLEHYSKSSA